MTETYTLGLVGARGHTGRELLKLIAAHPHLDLTYAASRELAGTPISKIAPEITEGVFVSPSFEATRAQESDIVVLAMPDGIAAQYVAHLTETTPHSIIVDLSADYRFDDQWVYGLPELNRKAIKGATRIANPGCYATAMQLAIAPLLDHIEGVPTVFGVSGYSGAGTKPSAKNDVNRLKDNLMPYKLHDHNHEREASRHLSVPIRFMPHVHPAFSGITTTVNIPIIGNLSQDQVYALFENAYKNEPLVTLQTDPPELQQGSGQNGVIIGGIDVSNDGKHACVVAAEDNLLKGAAVQAIQNINIALNLEEFTAIHPESAM